jgi:uncharacterized protein with NRDE domain
MCLILFALHHHPRYPLIVAANRDEFYSRPAAPAQFWEDHPNVLAGRDLEKGGTWLGITRTGRFAAVTNFRDPARETNAARSRGELVSRYLFDAVSPETYLRAIQKERHFYNGFNLIVGDVSSLWYYSSHTNRVEPISPGIHGLSNHLLDTPWPKVVRGKQMLEQCLRQGPLQDPDCFFEILADSTRAEDRFLPDTGAGLEWERVLSPIFIASPAYGTRSSTVVLVDRFRHVRFMERFLLGHAWTSGSYEFDLEEP